MKIRLLYPIVGVLLLSLFGCSSGTSAQNNISNNSSSNIIQPSSNISSSVASSSNQIVSSSSSSSSNDDINSIDDYDYRVIDGKVELIKFKGVYRSLIEVPEMIDGKVVSSIANGCFKKEKINTVSSNRRYANKNDEHNEESDYSTYMIGENVENIDEDAFEDNSTFATPHNDKPHGWKDTSMTGSAKDGNGNVYYNTKKQEVIVNQGIVYVKDRTLGTLLVARCLTNKKEVEIPSEVDGIVVADVGRDSFSFNAKIEKVIFPDTIGYVYSFAFNSCINLKEVVFKSKTLSKILQYAFMNCKSLDIVVLPENCTFISTGAFSYCGTISELHIPFTMTRISSLAFVETTIKKIIYSGTKEQWEAINIAQDVLEVFNAAEIQYSENQEKVEINNLNEILEIDDNTLVTATGVITGYYSNSGLFITDPEDNFTIFCFNDDSLPFSDIELVGTTVKVTGTKIRYTGQIELTNCQFEILDLPKVDIAPTEIDWKDPDIKVEELMNKYVVIRGVVSRVSSRSAWIEGIDYIQIYYHYHWEDSPRISVGDNVEIVGMTMIFNQIYEITYDTRLVKIL